MLTPFSAYHVTIHMLDRTEPIYLSSSAPYIVYSVLSPWLADASK